MSDKKLRLKNILDDKEFVLAKDILQMLDVLEIERMHVVLDFLNDEIITNQNKEPVLLKKYQNHYWSKHMMENITGKVKQMVIDDNVPDELGIPEDMYIQLLDILPLRMRMSRNDGTENVIFPLFSNCKVYPLGQLNENC